MKTEVFISGAGPAGATLAILLAKSGLSVVLADPVPSLPLKQVKMGTRTSAVMQSWLPLLEETGALAKIREHTAPLEALSIIDAANPQFGKAERFDYAASEIGEKAFSLNIPNGYLRAALFEIAASTKNLTLITDSGFESAEQHANGITITLENGQTIEAQLLVGADGRKSKVRENAKLPVRSSEYGQSGITCRLSHTKPHQNRSTEFHYKGGPFTLVPLPAKHSALVWLVKDEDSARLKHLGKDSFTQEIQTMSKGELGQLTLEEGPEICPIVALSAPALTAPRTALIAEAAHVLSPIGAQGFNLSLADVAALKDLVIEAHHLGLDIGSDTLLKRYEKQRKPDLSLRQNAVDTLNRMVASESGLPQILRRAGLSGLSAITPLRKKLMRAGYKA
ncbi:MAG: FAD-dependent monooxygenase [Pseudobdellovibrionaceae bacterium]